MARSPFFILLVEPESDVLPAWAEASARAHLDKQIYFVHSAAEAIEYILKVRGSPTLATPGIVLIQCAAGTDSLALIAHWIRREQSLAWVIPVALIAADGSDGTLPYYDAGARSCLPAPETLDERILLLEEIRRYWQSLNVWPEALPRGG